MAISILIPDPRVGDTEYEKVTVPDQLSPSKINQFKKCPKQFQYRSLRFLFAVADDTAMEFGKMLHRVVERFYDKIGMKDEKYTIPTPAEIKRIANLCLEHEWLPRFQSRQRTVKKAVANFILFEQNRLKRCEKESIPYKVTDEEGSVTDPLVEMDIYSSDFHAIVDWFWKAGKQLLDFKFGKSDEVHDSYKIQLSIERHVVEFHEMVVEFAGFGFFRKSPMPSRVATYKIAVLKDLRRRLLSAVAKNQFPREKNDLCWYCGDYIRCVAEEKGLTLWSGVLI